MSEFTSSMWRRPAVKIYTAFKESSYAPDYMEVEIDSEAVSAADIVQVLAAMSHVAYGPIGPDPATVARYDGQMALIK